MKKLKIFPIVSTLLILILFSGCATKEVIKYVDRPVEVVVETKCTIPETKCEKLTGTIINKLSQAMQCIINLRESQKVCQ